MTERDIFVGALQRDDPDARRAYLAEACGSDDALRARVEELLAVHGRAADFLESPPVGPAATVDLPTADGAGTVIGPYKLLEQIGEGGFGVVFLAEQSAPVRRRVALKILKPGMDTRQVVARFEAERQALAIMDHPNIAKVLDGGATPSGRPYFVMELVKGVPITEYCDHNHLTPHQRLELFVQVCQAVQHAHQKGIIHRDLKPSNVLIARYDERPVPKVIDFGVAKAVGQPLTDKTLVTGLGAVVGTPEYMSPEQAEVNQLDIDTRSDIYSLGVLLYELLTGSPPFSRKDLEKAGLLEILRVIREEEPSKPSTKLSTAEGLPTLAANRGTEPAKLTKLVRGELDWIVMKALEKNRNRRYETANGFAQDVQRYLADEPVLACPPSARYRLRKFVRRNSAVLATAAVVAAALVIAVVGLAVSNHLVTRARDQIAQALSNESAALTKAREQETLANERAQEARKQETLANERELEARKQQGIARDQELLARRRYYAAQMNLAMQAWRAGEVPRVLELLEGQRPGAGEEDLRAFEWYYLWGLTHSGHRASPRGHSTGALSVAFSPDGRTLASASWDHTVRFWNVDTGTEQKVLRGHNGLVWDVVYSPDGKMLVSGGKDTPWMVLWDVATGHPLHFIRGPVLAPRFARGGKTVIGARVNGTVLDLHEWDVASGKELTTIAGAGAAVGASPDGKTFVTLAGQHTPESEVRVWDAATSARRLTIPSPGIYAATVSADGSRVATSAWRSVAVWDVATGKRLATYPTESPGRGLAFSPDGKKFAAGLEDRRVLVWDLASGEKLGQYFHLDVVWGVAFSPDGKALASATLGGAVKLWDLTPTEETTTVPVKSAHCGQFSPDGKTFLVGNTGRTKVIDVATGKEVAELLSRNVVTISADANVLAERVGRDEYALWDARAGRKVAAVALPQRPGVAPRAALSPDGKVLAGYGSWHENNTVSLWDSTARETRVLKVPPPKVNRHSIHCVAFSPDGKLLAGGFQFQWVIVWDVATGAAKLQFSQQPSMMNITSLAFSPDGKALAVGGDVGAVTLWDVGTGKRLVAFRGHTSPVNALAFSPDGRTLATAGADKTVRLWDVVTGQERAALTGHSAGVGYVQFSPDGYTLATGSSDGTVKFWRGATDAEALAARAPAFRDPNIEAAAAAHRRGMSLYAEGKWEEAIGQYQKAIELDPASAWPHLNVGLARRRQGKLNEAVAAFLKAIELDPGYVYAHAALANVLADQGKKDEAVGFYRKAIALSDRADVDAVNYLGVSLNKAAWNLATAADVGLRNPALAVEFAGEAVRFGPHWNTLGAARYRAGDYRGAVAALETSMKLRAGGDSFDWFFLALAHWHLDRKVEARAWYDRAVAWMDKHKPGDAELIRFRAEVRELLEAAGKGGVEIAPPPREKR